MAGVRIQGMNWGYNFEVIAVIMAFSGIAVLMKGHRRHHHR